MILEALQFLASNKAAVIGAAVTISEVVVIGVNTYRRLKANAQKVQLAGEMPMHRTILWAANPLNLFRKV